jgi:hypothetical protein
MSPRSSNYLPSSLPPITVQTSPTTSTEQLISAPCYTSMEDPQQCKSSTDSKDSSSSSDSCSRSTTKRSRRSSHPGHSMERLAQTVNSEGPTSIHSPPHNPPSAHLPALRPSEDLAPSISPSALEAGFAKELYQSHVSRTATGEKTQSRHNASNVWPPWKRQDGWAGWRSEWVKKESLVVPLVVQAFSAGVLDATTYADFMTFASNRKSIPFTLQSRVAGHRLMNGL